MVTTETVCFDKESGQVYTEQTCKAGPSIPDWLLKSRGSIKQVTNFVNIGPGCSSLRAMSRRCIVFNAFNLTPEAIEALPVHLAQRVWQEITRDELDSLRLWRLFVLAFGNRLDHRGLEYKRIFFRDPSLWMTGWINQIVAPSFDWVTFLTLNDVHLSRTDLIQVSRLTNLGVLMVGRIHGEDLDLDDNIVRAWSRAASEAGAFARLRILVCRTQHLITGQVFTHFEHFPQLALLFVDDHHCTSAFKHRAWEHHWRKMKELPRRLLSSEAGTSKHRTWYNVYGWCFSDGVFDSKVLDDQHKCAREGPPVLDLVSGPADCHWLRGSTVVADMTMFARKSRSMGNKQIHQKSQENDWPIILPGAANRRLENV